MFLLRSDLLVQVLALTNVATDAKVTGATVSMSIFDELPLKLNTGHAVNAVQRIVPSSTVVNTIAFTDGGDSSPADYEIKVGDKVVCAAGGESAIVKSVAVTSGAWSTNNAAGTLELTSQSGVFQAGDLNVGATTSVAAIVSDTGKGGSFKLSFDGATTTSIDGNATLATIKSALQALSNITTVNVTGAPLDTDPVSNGFSVEWASVSPQEDGNVPLLTISIVSLIGPANVTITEQVQGHLVGAARDAGAGKVGLPIEAHGRVAAGYVHIIGSSNYDGEEVIDSVERDEILITATYVAEVFSGKEEVYVGIKGTGLPGISLSDDSGGDYSAYLPEDLKRYTRGKRCILLVTIEKAGIDLLIAKTSPTGFYKG